MKLSIVIPSVIAGAFATLLAYNVVGTIGDLSKPPLLPPPAIPQESGQNYIRVVKTGEVVESTRDPIWRVELIVQGQVIDHTEALIGISYRQNENRHTAGNKSPLPVGSYRIDSQGIALGPFDDPEVGQGYWIPVTPLFPTGRSALGIHHDPSWGKLNKESGTSGCIGLKTPEDTERVEDWIRRHRVRTVQVVS